MKADRLIALLLLLQSRRQCAARELARRLEVSERTIYRDVDALGAAGVPVYAERGAHGGIVLADGYRRALTHFTEEEIRALFVSGASALADLGLDAGFERALEKLHGGLADVAQRAAEKSRSRIHLDARRWNQAEPPRALLAALRRAVWDDRCLRIRYEDRNRTTSTRAVDPLGLVSKAGVWYLVARHAGELRSFRVDRIRTADELTEHFERPADFDLERYWRETSARFAHASRSADLMVTLRVRNDAIERVTAYWPGEVVARRTRDSLIRVTFPGHEIAVFQLIAWADAATLVEPSELREEIVVRARRTLRRFENR
ncbi:MAG TPA: YafY family protein [Candidatus Cybelea sp.]|nr:YafY family protein [Candidatus Cybelea sp.]